MFILKRKAFKAGSCSGVMLFTAVTSHENLLCTAAFTPLSAHCFTSALRKGLKRQERGHRQTAGEREKRDKDGDWGKEDITAKLITSVEVEKKGSKKKSDKNSV